MTSYTFQPDIGGVTSFNTDICTELARLGQRVTLACLTPGTDDCRLFEVVRRPSPRRLFQLGQQADVILFSNLSLQLALPLMSLRKPMALFHHSEAAWLSPRSAPIRIVERLVLRRMARHFPTSCYLGRVSRLAHAVVHPPFDRDLQSEIPHCPVGERRNVLFVGRLVPEKGLSFLVSRQQEIRRILGCEQILIAGAGEMRSWVENEAHGSPALTFLGRLSRREVMEEMSRAAYVMVPSLCNEPFGIVALEALVAASILISSNRGGLPEAGGALGHYFDPDNPSDFVRALSDARAQRDLLVGSSQADEARQAQLNEHLQAFSGRAIAQALLEHLRSMVKALP